MTRIQKRRFIDDNPNVQSPVGQAKRHRRLRLVCVELHRVKPSRVRLKDVIRRRTISSHQRKQSFAFGLPKHALVRGTKCETFFFLSFQQRRVFLARVQTVGRVRRPQNSNVKEQVIRHTGTQGNEVSQQWGWYGDGQSFGPGSASAEEAEGRVLSGQARLTALACRERCGWYGGECGRITMEMRAWHTGRGRDWVANSSGCHDVHADMGHRQRWCGIEACEVLGGGRDQQSFVSLGPSQGHDEVATGGSRMGLLISRTAFASILLLKNVRPLCTGPAAVALLLHCTRDNGLFLRPRTSCRQPALHCPDCAASVQRQPPASTSTRRQDP